MKKFRTLIATIISLSLCFSTPKVVHAEQDLGPVTSKDVIYQIITDRFYDGDPSNNVQTNNEVFDDMDHDGYGDGNDLKLYQGGDFKGIIDKIPYLKEMGVTAVWISAPYENRDDPIIDYQPDGSVNIW